jgi:hypothetical protein
VSRIPGCYAEPAEPAKTVIGEIEFADLLRRIFVAGSIFDDVDRSDLDLVLRPDDIPALRIALRAQPQDSGGPGTKAAADLERLIARIERLGPQRITDRD